MRIYRKIPGRLEVYLMDGLGDNLRYSKNKLDDDDDNDDRHCVQSDDNDSANTIKDVEHITYTKVVPHTSLSSWKHRTLFECRRHM